MPVSDYRVLVGREDVSPHLSDRFSFSSVDPGGFETAAFAFPPDVRVRRGQRVRIEHGLDVAFEGRVAEVERRSGGTTVACEGSGAVLKDGRMVEVYVDRDPSSWTEATLARKIDTINVGFARGAMPAGPSADGLMWEVPAEQIPEYSLADLQYVMPDGLLFSRLATQVENHGGLNGFQFYVWYGIGSTTPVYRAALVAWTGLTYLDSWDQPDQRRYLTIALQTGSLPPTVAARQMWISPIAVYGSHGAPPRPIPGDPDGFYPSDAARDAISRVPGVAEGVIETADDYVIPHLVFKTPVPHEEVVAQSARFVGWHWGTWEAPLLGGEPEFHFRSRPTRSTCFLEYSRAEDLELSERLGDLYDTVQVAFNDPAAGDSIVTRTRPNAELEEAGVSPRVLDVQIGVATRASAETFGDFALALSEQIASAAGTCRVKGDVDLPSGGRKPASLLKPGRDRLRIPDLPGMGAFATDGRADFHLRRAETTVSREGEETGLELGSGASLLEVLQARLEVATQLAGAG